LAEEASDRTLGPPFLREALETLTDSFNSIAADPDNEKFSKSKFVL